MKALVAIFISVLCLAAAETVAQPQGGPIEVIRPWSRATPKGATTGAGYVTLRNTGTTPDRLIGGSTEVGKRVEIHTMEMAQGVMRMRQLTGGLEIKPGETVELKPGSLHLMFVDLTRPLQNGEHIKGTLVFERAGKVDVDYTVEVIGSTPTHGQRGH